MEIKVIKNILGENDRIAAENQAMFQDKKVFVLNFMGSPGAGKTSVLEKTMEQLKDNLQIFASASANCLTDSEWKNMAARWQGYW